MSLCSLYQHLLTAHNPAPYRVLLAAQTPSSVCHTYNIWSWTDQDLVFLAALLGFTLMTHAASSWLLLTPTLAVLLTLRLFCVGVGAV